uniref:Rieske domain-containing protein-like n=1 Tax=Cyprinus carpio TaxID=7962 RepID=A0A8C1QDJ3_CYPCA
MTSPEDESVSWRLIGPVSELSKKQCRLIYSSDGRDADVCLFHVNSEFFAMDARCAHSGGPLCDGDIEEADGVLRVFCPWHDYDFNLKTGNSSTGLQLNTVCVQCEVPRRQAKEAVEEAACSCISSDGLGCQHRYRQWQSKAPIHSSRSSTSGLKKQNKEDFYTLIC